MINSITIENFKSYKRASFKLAPLSLLIGPNASGKSNAIEAIRLLSSLARGTRLDDIERNINGSESLLRGQAGDLFYEKNEYIKFGCDVSYYYMIALEIGMIDEHLIMAGENVTTIDGDFLYEIDDTPHAATDEIEVMYNNFKRGGHKPHIKCSNRMAIFYQLETPARFNREHEKSQEIIPEATKKIREALRSIVFLDPKPSLMRDYSYSKDNEIKEDGSNLSSVLFSIWNNNEQLGNKTYSKHLLNFVRSLPEQDITGIEFIQTDRSDVMVRLIESFGGRQRKIDAPLLSDGTLRVLSVAALLLTAPLGALVVIEEIDNGIHPSRAERLIQSIIEVSNLRQLRILLTTHNPALLDALPDKNLADVLCCYRDPDEGDSRIVRLGNFDRYPELVARGPLGQLMTKGILDRLLKDKSTKEQRKQAALDWVENLATEEAQ